MSELISIIIPCHNSAQTLGICLQSILLSEYWQYEIIVVDDYSSDGAGQIANKFPCRVISLNQHRGAGYARNVGAQAARGSILFFTDADCVLQKDTLGTVAKSLTEYSGKVEGSAIEVNNIIVGGTYTAQPYDTDFFSRFQSLFIRYSETKQLQNPDYIATHALAMRATLFHQHAGFHNHEYPILEDVEYSHRLKRHGVDLIMNPDLQVQHIFNFSFLRSMRNAVRKSRYWTAYIMNRQDLLADSGTASHELKFNTLSFGVALLLLALFSLTGNGITIALLSALILVNLAVNFSFLTSIYREQGLAFTFAATGYYLVIYPGAVSTGSVLGISSYLKQRFAARRIA